MDNVWVIGDLHLGHYNIIRYCKRPFVNVKIMNQALIDNWNALISQDDLVYFLGDLSNRKEFYWRKALNGKITFIRGNHDSMQALDSLIIEHQGIKFLLIHDPELAPKDFDGWVIHAHKHNNDLAGFPFFNPDKRMVNVSVEVIDYKPVLLDDVIKKIMELKKDGIDKRKED